MSSKLAVRLAAVASAAAVIAGLTTLAAPPASAATAVSVVSYSSYLDGAGFRHFVGEVRNDGNTNIQNIQVSLQYLDASNTLLATDFAFAGIDVLAPGEKSPFQSIDEPPAGFDHYTASVTADATSDQPNHFFTTSVTSEFTDSTDFRHVVGTVRNDNTTDAEAVEVHVTFYDAAGKVVNAESASAADDVIAPAQSSTFEVAAAATPAFSSYAILAESGSPAAPAGGPDDVTPTLSLSPSIISAGQRVTVTYVGKPSSTLEIWSKTQPATAYSRISSVTLDASGHGTSSHAPTKNTRIMAKTASGLTSAQPLIQVRSVASLNARRVGTRTYTFTGRVYPALNGRLVSLYRNGALTAQARTDASGVYTMTKTIARGTYSFQVRTANDTYNLGTSSPARTYSIL